MVIKLIDRHPFENLGDAADSDNYQQDINIDMFQLRIIRNHYHTLRLFKLKLKGYKMAIPNVTDLQNSDQVTNASKYNFNEIKII